MRAHGPLPSVEAIAAPKLTPNRILVVILLVAAGLAAALIAVSVTGGNDQVAPAAGVHGAATTNALLAGIPQNGNVLGNPKAPVTVIEYADPQCPYCARWALETFPALVREYVRPGKVKIVFNGIPIVGPDSVPALQATFAAGEQRHLWNVAELLFHNQGTENTGWVTDDLLRSIGEAVPGLDVTAMMDGRNTPAVTTALADAQAAAAAAGISSTPSFQIGRTGGSTSLLEGALPTDEFRQALDRLLAQ